MRLRTKFCIIFGPLAENKFESVFPGGVYVVKNTLSRVFVRGCFSLSKNFSKAPEICIMEETGV